jgi:hypothetical protein
MSDFKKTSDTESSVVVKRRSFLKKSATGAVLASLPAQSVWGACSPSGMMSGNLSQNTGRHNCPTPIVSSGKSPKYWRDTYNNVVATNLKVFEGFSACTDKDTRKHKRHRKCYKNHIVSCCEGLNLDLPTELYDRPYGKLKDALLGSGTDSMEYCLAGVYLSSFFGFHNDGSMGDRTKASKKVNDIYIYFNTMANQGLDVSFSELESLCNFTAQHKTDYVTNECIL